MELTTWSVKFIRKFMLIAKSVGEIENPCYSRHIGAIVVNPETHKIIGTGYNGPPAGTPHTDDPKYLREYFWPQLTFDEKKSLQYDVGGIIEEQETCNHIFNATTRICEKCNLSREGGDTKTIDYFVDVYANKGNCPRRLVGAKSGERSVLCTCQHAERNAITNSCCDTHGYTLFCWCGVPCLDCTGAIINSGIKEVHCLRVIPDYSLMSRWLFEQAKVEILEWEMSQL